MDNYLVYTGNFYPHKNLSILIQAAEELKLKTYLLGKNSIFAARLPKSQFVQLLHGLSDQQINEFYKHALCFVMPSKLEGFGLPGLEAMAASCPVIAANASCLPEIYGDAALYFDPSNASDLVQKIKSLQENKKLRTQFISAGLIQSQKYSWSTTANQTWQIYLKELH